MLPFITTIFSDSKLMVLGGPELHQRQICIMLGKLSFITATFPDSKPVRVTFDGIPRSVSLIQLDSCLEISTSSRTPSFVSLHHLRCNRLLRLS